MNLRLRAKATGINWQDKQRNSKQDNADELKGEEEYLAGSHCTGLARANQGARASVTTEEQAEVSGWVSRSLIGWHYK